MATPAKVIADQISQMTRPIRRPIEQARTVRALGLFKDPYKLIKQIRHRKGYAKLQKVFFYQRYAAALLLGHQIGLFARLAERPHTAASLARSLKIRNESAEGLLRILHAEGYLNRRGGRYSLTPFARDVLAPGGPISATPMLDLLAAQSAAFADIPEGMRTSEPPPVLNIFGADSAYIAFLEAVNAFLDMAARDLLSKISLPPIASFIVGSMGVSFSAALLRKYPSARVNYGCLDHLVREIPRLVEDYGVPKSAIVDIHAHGGDPQDDRWGDEAFDLVFLTKKMILAPDERMGEKFARKAFDVLNPGGVAIFWETLHADQGPTPISRAMEGVMDLAASPAGKINSEVGIKRLMTDIGYARTEIVTCLDGQTTFAVAYK